MAYDSAALHQQLGPLIAGPAALRRVAKKTNCPAAQLHTLLAVHLLNSKEYAPLLSAAILQDALQVSLPLARSYVRGLEARGYLERKKFFTYRHGPRLLSLTDKGKEVVRLCRRELRQATMALLA